MDEFSKYSKEEWRKEFNNEYKMMKKFHVDNDGKIIYCSDVEFDETKKQNKLN